MALTAPSRRSSSASRVQAELARQALDHLSFHPRISADEAAAH